MMVLKEFTLISSKMLTVERSTKANGNNTNTK